MRLDSRAECTPTKLHCLPIYTGEDIPDNGSSNLGSLVRFPPPGWKLQRPSCRCANPPSTTKPLAWHGWNGLRMEVHRKANIPLAAQVWAETYEKVKACSS